jgi:hypothetical protein
VDVVTDDVLRIVPADPSWQPDDETALRVAELVRSRFPVGEGGWTGTRFADRPELLDCGNDVQRVGCPACAGEIDHAWFVAETEHRDPHLSLDRVTPCCGAATTLDALVVEPPVAFARFSIEVWDPTSVNDAAVEAVEQVLDQPVLLLRVRP